MDLKKHLIDPAKKDKKWALGVVQDYYTQAKESWIYNRRMQWAVNEKYFEGNQETSDYMKKMNTSLDDPSCGARINWTTLPILNHYMDIYLNLVYKQRFVNATSIDPTSTDVKMRKKYDLEAKIRYQDLFKMMGDDIPDVTLEEIDTYLELDPKEREEVMIEVAADYVLNANEGDKIWRDCDEQIAKYGMVGVREVIGDDGMVKVEPLPLKTLLVPDSEHRDYRDAEFYGIEKAYSIFEIASRYPELELSDLKKIAAAGEAPAGQRHYSPDDLRTDKAGNPMWMRNRVIVAEWEFLSIDEKYYQERENSKGETIVTEEQYGKKRSKRSKRKMHQKRWQKWYKCSWIRNTDIIVGFAQLENMKVHPNNPFDCPSSFHLYKVYEKPPVERAIPVIDQIHLDWYNLQNVKSKARPDSIAIDYSALFEAVPTGDVEDPYLAPSEIVSLYQNGEVLFYKSKNSDDPYSQGNGLPIIPIPGGMGKIFEQYTSSLYNNLDLLRRMIGISEGLDATTPEARQSVRGTFLAAEGTKNALKTHRFAMKDVFKRCVEGIVLRLQDYVRYGKKLTVYQYGIGEEAITPITLSEGVVPKMFGIVIEEEPDPEVVQQIVADAANLKATRDQQGAGGIDTADFYDVDRFLKKGRIKQAIAKLKLAKAKALRQDMEKAKALSEQNGQIQMQSAQAAEQAKQQTLEMSLNLEAQRDDARHQKDLELINIKHKNALEMMDKQISLKEVVDAKLEEQKTENKIEVEKAKAGLSRD